MTEIKKVILILFLMFWPNSLFAKQLSKFPFIPDEIYNEFNSLPKNHKIRTCGFENFNPKWKIINKNLAKKLRDITLGWTIGERLKEHIVEMYLDIIQKQ